MPRVRKLLELARNYYVQANATVNPDAKRALQELGDKYIREADNLQRYKIIQARFPQTGARPSQSK